MPSSTPASSTCEPRVDVQARASEIGIGEGLVADGADSAGARPNFEQ